MAIMVASIPVACISSTSYIRKFSKVSKCSVDSEAQTSPYSLDSAEERLKEAVASTNSIKISLCINKRCIREN